MASKARKIKRRLRSIKNIQQITQAMEMVAAAKMRRAQEKATRSQPYSERLTAILGFLASKTDPRFHPLLQKGRGEKKLLLLIVPQRGLCGPLLTNLTRTLLSQLEEERPEFILVGQKGEELAKKLNLSVAASFSDLPEEPLYSDTLPISRIIIEDFVGGKCQKVSALYPHFINTLSQRPEIITLLPLKEEIGPAEEKWPYVLYEPDPKSILKHLLPFYLRLLVYHLILEGIASEHSARMVAMRNATDNAGELLKEITLAYHQVRQADITRQVAEIAAARAALEYYEKRV